MLRILLVLHILLTVGISQAIEVCAMHPLLADLAKQVGGADVTVYDVVGEGNDPHEYDPRPADVQRMQKSAILFYAGKGLESYIDKLKDTVPTAEFINLGASVPSLKSHCEHENAHHHDDEDVHWWHSIENMKRASRVVAAALAKHDPTHAEQYEKNAAAYSEKLSQLSQWAKKEFSQIPIAQRKIVVAHDAFAYFAKEFSLQVIAVAGMNNEQEVSPAQLKKSVDEVRAAQVKAVFPEIGMSDKTLKMIAAEVKCKIAEPLIADGNGRGAEAGFEGMIRHNVLAIVKALKE